MTEHTCRYCGGMNARTPIDEGGFAHKRCIPGHTRYRELAPVPATAFRTTFAPGAPWPYLPRVQP